MFKLMSWRWNLINFAALLDWSCETANYSDFTEKQQILNQIWRIANAFHCQVFHCFEFHSFNVKILDQKVRFAECYISSPCSIQIGENGSISIRVNTSKGEWKGSEKKLDQILGLNRSARLNRDSELWTLVSRSRGPKVPRSQGLKVSRSQGPKVLRS